MKRNAVVLLVVVAAVALMLYAGRHMAKSPGYSPAKVTGDARGSIAPDFELKSLEGKTVRLSDYKGKAVLLNFWATWCGPCKIEMPWFVELQKQYAAQGLEVLGVAMDDSGEETIAKFAREMGVNYPILVGKEAVGEAYGVVQFLPTTIYINRQGRVVERVFGLVSHSEIEDSIKKALGSGTAANPPPATPAVNAAGAQKP